MVRATPPASSSIWILGVATRPSRAAARTLEAGPGVLATLAHRCSENVVDRRLAVGGRARLFGCARHGRHGADPLGQLGENVLDRVALPDGDEAAEAMLVVDRAGDADRFVGGAEVGVAADLQGDLMAQLADAIDVAAGRRLVELPPHMQLVEALVGPPAGLHHQRRRPQVMA